MKCLHLLILLASALLLSAQSPNPQPSSRRPAETKGGEISNLENNPAHHDKAQAESAAASANSLNATKPDQTQTAHDSKPTAPVAPIVNVHIDNHDTVIAWATGVFGPCGFRATVFARLYLSSEQTER
jgi:hypothetical protein